MKNADLARGALEVGVDGYPDDEPSEPAGWQCDGGDARGFRCGADAPYSPDGRTHLCATHMANAWEETLAEARQRKFPSTTLGLETHTCAVTTDGGRGSCDGPALKRVDGDWYCPRHAKSIQTEPDRLPGACDPRNLEYFVGVAARLSDLSERLTQLQHDRAEIGADIDSHRYRLASNHIGEEARILRDYIAGCESLMSTTVLRLDELARQRVDLLAESRLAASWLTYASTVKED